MREADQHTANQYSCLLYAEINLTVVSEFLFNQAVALLQDGVVEFNRDSLSNVYHLVSRHVVHNFASSYLLIHVNVFDSLGAGTAICRIPIEVKPRSAISAGTSGLGTSLDDGPRSNPRKTPVGNASQQLHEEAEELYSLALSSTFDGGSHGLLLPLTELGVKLNQQARHSPCHHILTPSKTALNQGFTDGLDSQSTGTGPDLEDFCQNRARSRELVIDSLGYIPLRDEVELLQALDCIVEVTAVSEELNWHALVESKSRLKEISHNALSRLFAPHTGGQSSGLSGRGLRLTVEAASNLLQSLASQLKLYNKQMLERIYRHVTEVALEVLNDAIQIALQFHSIGEKPLSLRGNFVSVNASLHSVSSSPPTVAINGMSFQLSRGVISTVRSSLNIYGKEEEGEKKESISTGPRKEVISGNNQWSQTRSSCYQTRSILFLRNPFAFMAKGNDMIQSEVASLDVYNCLGTEMLSIEDLPNTDNINIILPRASSSGGHHGSLEPSTHTEHYLDKTTMNTHYLNSSAPQRFSISQYRSSYGVRPEELRKSIFGHPDSGQLTNPISHGYLHVHIQFQPVPDGRRSFPVLVILSQRNPPHNLKEHDFKQYYGRDVEEIKILLPSHVLEGHQYHITVVEASFNSGRRRPTEVQRRNYTLNTWWSDCLYWNISMGHWSSNGCHVMPSSSVNELHCRCNHLSTFGSHFELIPTYLSYTDVDGFFFSLHENPIVVVLVALVLLIYIVGVLLLSSADAQDTKKDASSCIFLQDNATSHHQKYEIALETGFNRHAGTTSKISIILHGEEGMSETRELISDDNRPMFECNSRDRFIVTLPESLGRIHKIQLWHNNSGSSPGWYLRQAVVRDLNSGQAAYFLCQRWLAVDREDGKVEREFTAVEGRNISFSMVFWLKGSQYLSDFHTWMSVLTRPPHSRFTRVQRLTVCLTLLSAYMCLSALWFKQVPQTIHSEFGLLDLSWHNIIVGCVCCLIIVPLNLLLGFLFRRSRVHYPGYERDRAVLNDLAKPGGAGVGDLSDAEEYQGHSQVTYSILDQSILNWQSIQDWAQKQWLKRQHSVRSSANSVKTSQTSPQLSAPSTTPLVQTLLAEYDTDHASSAWDASSRAAVEKFKTKTTSDDSSSDVSDILNSSRRLFLPFWCRYLAWILCISVICTSITVTIMYGFRFGHTKGVMWIQSVYFSFIVCIFIVQPLLIVLRVLHISLRHRKNLAVFNHYEDGFYGEKGISSVLNKQHSFSSEEDEELQRGVAARSRSRYLRFAGPPQEKQLKSSRKRQIKQKRALLLLRDLLCFFVMVIILSTIAFGKDTRSPFMFNKAVKEALAENIHDGLSFRTIKVPNDWYQWSKAAIINSLYSQALFSGEQQKNTSKSVNQSHPTETLGWLGLVVGQIQLRQLQTVPQDCKPVPYFRGAYDELGCLPSSGSGAIDKGEFNSNKIPWEYVIHGENLLNPGLWGQSTWYDDSGYVVKLDKSREVAASQLQELKKSKWISTDTQAVFVEMTLYNVPTNLFSSVTLLMEVASPLGTIFTTEYVMSTRLFRYVSFFDNIILACELLFVVITLWMMVHEMQGAIKMGKAYFYHFWNYLQLTMCAASLLYVLVYICRFILVSDAIETLRSTFFEEFVNISSICWCDQMLQDLVAIVLFCVIVKSLRILRYHQVFWKLQTVYRRCRQEIFLAAVLYVGLITAFSCLATGLFGSIMYNLRSVWSSFLTLSALSIRVFNWSENMDTAATKQPLLAVVLLFGYIFLHGFVITYIFAVLSQRLKKTRKCRVLALSGRQLLSFYWDILLKMIGIREEPTVEQTDNTLPAEFTMAEILYLVEELLFRMNAVLGTSGLPNKHHSFSDSDSPPNDREDAMSSGGSMDQALITTDDGPFVCQPEGPLPRLEQRLQKIEDKLCSQEPYLAQLLKLDSIGADVLSEEKEKELRSHLEFEIFRQLQMQRRETAPVDVENAPYSAFSNDDLMNDFNAVGLEHIEEAVTNLLSRQSSLSKSKQSTQPLPCSKLTHKVQTGSAGQQSHRDKRNGNQGPAVFISDAESLLSPPKRTLSMKVTGKQARTNQLLGPEVVKGLSKQTYNLRKQDLVRHENPRVKTEKSVGGHTQKVEHQMDKKDFFSATTIGTTSSRDKRFRVDVLYKPDGIPTSSSRSGGNSSGRESDTPTKSQIKHKHGLAIEGTHHMLSFSNASPQSSESDGRNKQNDSSSRYSCHERSNLLRKKPELASKISNKGTMPAHSPESIAARDSGIAGSHGCRTFTGWIPKPKQFNFLPELINPLAAESSSGSEPEVTSSRNRGNQGRRNLRKTKSRGKGKGREGGISNSIDLAADFVPNVHSGGSEFDIIIHRVPSELDREENILTEEFPQL
ncbi:hypothetical protein RRG08_010520 [Elysia crispata]|uniref:Uncharacterized protein n=1 Tax=Elysia crispata TaxID=231223 RepID=A0AAE1ANQ4_9GAST|nr:hypothetical protein RRG08_010520 [Elysia crispata]